MGGIGKLSENSRLGSFAPGNGSEIAGMSGSAGSPGVGGIGSERPNPISGNLQRDDTNQDHGTTVFGGAMSVADPVVIQE